MSRHWKAASAKQVKELAERSLAELDLVAVMIDGIEFHGHMVLAALGFTADGKKRVLGLWQGATENARVCQDLLDNLVERGLRTDQKLLFVLDGAKALSKAVKSTFGSRQRSSAARSTRRGTSSPISPRAITRSSVVVYGMPGGSRATRRRRRL